MTKEEIISEANSLINEYLIAGCTDRPLEREERFVEDLNADSLDRIELLMEAEERFNIEIADEKADEVETVGDMHDLLISIIAPEDPSGR